MICSYPLGDGGIPRVRAMHPIAQIAIASRLIAALQIFFLSLSDSDRFMLRSAIGKIENEIAPM